jgi:chemotaxis protein MotB
MTRKGVGSTVSHERWLVSYADFITLLFAFFVVLYAFASVDRKRQAQVSAAIDSGFQSLSIAPPRQRSDLKASMTLQPRSHLEPAYFAAVPVSAGRVRVDLEQIRQDLRKRLSTEIAQQRVSIDLGREGLVISLREAGFFDSGTAVPRPDATITIQQIGQSLAGTPYDVHVEGHTDDNPIHNAEFDSNWELSSARATRIARLLLEMHTIAPEQISAESFAEYRPLTSNDTAEGRAQNRRVDLVLMPRTFLSGYPLKPVCDKPGWRRITDPNPSPM